MSGTSLSTVYMLGIVCATVGGIAAAFLTLSFNPIPSEIESMNEKQEESSLLESATSAVGNIVAPPNPLVAPPAEPSGAPVLGTNTALPPAEEQVSEGNPP